MKKIWKRIDIFLSNKSFNKWYYIFPTTLFFIFSVILFSWEQDPFCFDDSIKTDVFSQFGDFFAGILGPLFSLVSILLLIKTFTQQQAITTENKELSISQRFNDMFFELINLYQSQTAELQDNVEINEIDENGETARMSYECDNKDFFDFNKIKIQQEFIIQKSYSKNRLQALSDFSNFYIRHKSKVGIYFRTLYRIFDLIDKSDLSEENRINYSKIVRAQLTESELFFLRYDAMSYSGSKFTSYINKYNVLKHIPHFELLEFKYWWSKLNPVQKNGIDVLFFMFKTSVKKLSKSQGLETISRKAGRYQFKIDHSQINKFVITIIKDDSKNSNIPDIVDGLEVFSIEDIERLFECLIKEIVIISNFNKYNIRRELEFFSEDVNINGSVSTIITGVRNTQNKKINFRYPHTHI